MKHRLTVGFAGLALAVALTLFGSSPASDAAPKKPAGDADNKVSEFMQAKLEASQQVLEGLVIEDYELVKKGADKMVVMSKATEWHVIQGPVYAQYSNEFRRSCEQLAKQAEKENIDGAALSYMHLTMTCISCHSFVRSSKIAAGEELPRGFADTLESEERIVRRLANLAEAK